jgi:basic amino acid/polyamine antiporter, APA family
VGIPVGHGREVGAAGGTRPLRLRHVYAIGTGAMFSSGFFLLPGLVADETGPSVPLAYLLAGVLALPTMLSVAELSTAMPRAGGPYHFLMRSMGPRVAVGGALGLWLALVVKAAFALAGVDAYLGLLLDLPPMPLMVGLAVLFTVVNLAGARESAGLQLGLVVVLLGVLAAFTVAGALDVAGTAPDARERMSPLFTDGVPGLFAAVAMVFIAYAGIPQIASVAGAVSEPGRTIPRAILASLVTGTVAYVGGTALMVLTLDATDLRDDLTPVATAVDQFALPGGRVLVVTAALAAFASTANAGILAASRYPMALAADGFLWIRFGHRNRAGVPVLAVLVSGAAVVAILVLLDPEGIATYGSAFVLGIFALFNLAVLVLRRGDQRGYDPEFRSPLHPWTQIVGLVAPLPLLADLGLGPLAFVAGVMVIGVAWQLVASRLAQS